MIDDNRDRYWGDYCPSCRRLSCKAWEVERAVRGAGWVRLDLEKHQVNKVSEIGYAGLVALLAIAGIGVQQRETFCMREFIPEDAVERTASKKRRKRYENAATHQPWIPGYVGRILEEFRLSASPWAVLFAIGYARAAETEAQRTTRVGALLTAWRLGQERAVFDVTGLDGFERTMASTGVEKFLAGLCGVCATFKIEILDIATALSQGLFDREVLLDLFTILRKEDDRG